MSLDLESWRLWFSKKKKRILYVFDKESVYFLKELDINFNFFVCIKLRIKMENCNLEIENFLFYFIFSSWPNKPYNNK